jgi:methanogenic corrinoid protein MtbC1
MTLAAEVEAFLAHVERGENQRATRGVLDLFDGGMSCAEIVADVLAPIQLEVGARWATAQWSVADEHLATAAVDDVLGALAARLEPEGQQTLALCSAEGEWHVTPLRMGALVLREQGWRVRLLGASTPPAHLRSTLHHLRPDVVVVHCAVPTNLPGVVDVVAVAHEAGLPVIAAGRGFGPDDHRALRLGCDGWAPDPRAGARLARAWLDAPPPRATVVASPHRDELEELRRCRQDLVDNAYRHLEDALPMMAGHDEHQRDHTRRDLHHILDAGAATLLVDDRRILADFLAWLQMLLVARGEPVAALEARLDALVDASGDLPGLCDLLGDRTLRP